MRLWLNVHCIIQQLLIIQGIIFSLKVHLHLTDARCNCVLDCMHYTHQELDELVSSLKMTVTLFRDGPATDPNIPLR
jgi:hypothetical protein